MSEKKGKSKRSKEPKSVMGNLSSTRPARMSRRRDANGDGEGAAQAKPAAPRKPHAATTAAQRKSAAAAKPSAAAKRSAAAKPSAAARPKAASSGPRAVRSGSPSLKTAAPKAPPKPRQSRPPKGTKLVTTAVQATGELAQIGVKLGVRAAKRAVDRLPKR